MRRKAYLIDQSHNRANLKKMAIYDTAAKICLYYGRKFTDRTIDEFWTFPAIPLNTQTFEHHVKLPSIKWYIREKMDIAHGIWNGSFLAGMTAMGKLLLARNFFTSFFWYRNDEVSEMIKECPFHGKLLTKYSESKGENRWSYVAALSLKSDNASISYLAGVLSTGRRYEIDGEVYAGYTSNLKALLMSYHIPIERECGRNKKIMLISPIWIALLMPWMPKSRMKWLGIKKAFKAEEYAFILWRVFTGRDIKAGGIPYLISRRTFYYRYHTLDNLEKKWVDYKLVELDSRFKEVVQKWSENDIPNLYNVEKGNNEISSN